LQTAALNRGAALPLWAPAAPSSYQATTAEALTAGATVDEVVGTLIAVGPTVGLARVVSAALKLAVALGYDLDEAP
jgi:4-carboxymuconolactone decarboxylase